MKYRNGRCRIDLVFYEATHFDAGVIEGWVDAWRAELANDDCDDVLVGCINEAAIAEVEATFGGSEDDLPEESVDLVDLYENTYDLVYQRRVQLANSETCADKEWRGQTLVKMFAEKDGGCGY